MTSHQNTSENSDPIAERIQQLIADYLERRHQGDEITLEALIEAHPDLMPELENELNLVRMLETPTSPVDVDADHGNLAQRAFSSAVETGRISVRCPHCHQPIDVLADTPFTDLNCKRCGSRFSLAGDGRQTQAAKTFKRLGHFELIERLGMGSFGTVWKARDTELDRTVASKIPREGKLSEAETEQFLREARAAAQLNHPHIVSVHEVGREEETVYIVSDLVRGLPLSDWLTGQQPTLQEATDLCAKVADALHHAHEAGVIHRDLKPQNIMLDDDNQPHLMDFGLARRDAGEITMTMDGRVLGTPAYMSPEQARGEAHQADRRSDIYSLGVILFELITGEIPFRGNARMLIHQVINDDAPSPRKLNGSVPKDLETICLKCLEKGPDKRYATARDVAAELRRFLHDKPIHARPVSATHRAWRWCRRNPIVAGLSVTVAISLLLGAVISSYYAMQANDRAAEAETARDSEAELRRQAESQAYAADMLAVQVALEDGDLGRSRQLLATHAPEPGREDLRGFEWRYFWGKSQGDELFTLTSHSFVVTDVAFLSDGKKLISSCWDGTVKLWDLNARQPLSTLSTFPLVFGISPNGRYMATGNYERVMLWAIREPQQPEEVFDIPGRATQIAFSPTGNLLAIGSGQPAWRGGNGTVTVWDYTSNAETRSFAEAGARAVFSPDGQLLATGSWNGSVRVWNLNDGTMIHSFENAGEVMSLVFAPDGKTLVTSNVERGVDVWGVESGLRVTSLENTDRVWRVVFSPDEKTFATASSDQTVRLWDAQTYENKTVLRGHGRAVISVAFSPDGKTLATGCNDGTIKLWQSDAEPVVTEISDIAAPVVFSPDSQTIAAQRGQDQNVTLWDVATRQPHLDLGPGGFPIAFQDGGSTLVVARAPDSLQYWNLATGKIQNTTTLRVDTSDSSFLWAALAVDGKLLATGHDNQQMIIWNAHSGEKMKTLNNPMQRGDRKGFSPFSPDSQIVASLEDNHSTFWNLASGDSTTTLGRHKMFVAASAFSPDGRVYATAALDSLANLWDVRTGSLIGSLAGHKAGLSAVAFSPDGRTLATAGDDQFVKLWNVRTHREVGRIRLEVGHLAFSPNGRTLACLDVERTLHLLDAPLLARSKKLKGEKQTGKLHDNRPMLWPITRHSR